MVLQTSPKTAWKKWYSLLVPAITAAIIFCLSHFPHWVEYTYAQKIFPHISALLRLITGIFPFSLGDLLYAGAVIWLFFSVRKGVLMLRRLPAKVVIRSSFVRMLTVFLWIYTIFYAFWGLNYYRLGIADQFKLSNTAVSTDDLVMLTENLVKKVNESKKLSSTLPIKQPTRLSLHQEAEKAYRILEKEHPFIKYRYPSFKKSMTGNLGNYIGFQGYYNPFTGESQIHFSTPSFLLPFIACHEVAHQLGYASESEANFIGFLAASKSSNVSVRYSAYMEMFMHAFQQLRASDSTAAKRIKTLLSREVQKDIEEYRQHILHYRNSLQDATGIFYDFYLKQNRQKNGIRSYGDVTTWMIRYQKKYSSIFFEARQAHTDQ